MKRLLDGKVALITGASMGVGYAIAEEMAKQGASLTLVARGAKALDEARETFAALGAPVIAVPGDVSDQASVEQMVSATLDRFGRIDVLVNAAGVYGPIGPVAETDAAEWLRAVRIILYGSYLTCRAVAPVMMRQRRGKIILFMGGGSTAPRPNFSAYACAKAGVIRLSETLAAELRSHNIQVNAMGPGPVNTRLLDELLAANPRAGEWELANARRQKESGGTPPSVGATLAAFLASDESSGLTGKVISATHDQYRSWPQHVDSLLNSDAYTMRRLDTYTLGKFDPNWKLEW